MRLTPGGAVAAVAVAVVVAPAPVNAQSSRAHPVEPSRILEKLKSGRAAIFDGIVVRKKLDLRTLETIRVPFKCRGCRFPRGIEASDVVFQRTLDLSGSRIGGRAEFQGTTFAGPALFTAAPSPVEFRRADFSLAVFDDLAGFDRAEFKGKADFGLSRFRTDASFKGTRFLRQVRFVGAALLGGALFDQSFFCTATFEDATFGTSHFRAATFAHGGSFSNAVFGGPADFSRTAFNSRATFDDAEFPRGAQFVGSAFTSTDEGSAASFAGATAGAGLDFSFASFVFGDRGPCTPESAAVVTVSKAAPTRDQTIAEFSGLVSAETLSFRQTVFPADASIGMTGLRAKNLVLDIGATARIAEDEGDPTANRRDVLRIIQSSAKSRDDLGTANKAAYDLHVLEARDYSWPHRLGDFVVYRGIAGYLVRPLHPLLALVVLALLLSALRLVLGRGSRSRTTEGNPSRAREPRKRSRPARRLTSQTGRLLSHFFDALASVMPRPFRGSDEEPLASRIERALYRILLACALIGLANSNPTLRQLVDSLL